MHRNKQSARLCVSCGQSSFTRLIDGYDFDTGEKPFALELCDHCGLTRTSPVLNADELGAYYEIDYYGSADKKFNPFIESWTIWSNKRLADKILHSARNRSGGEGESIRVLDIGCGRANLLKAFNRRGCQCFGVERSDFPDDPGLNNITVYKQDFLDIPLQENHFDIVVIWHVLEHLTDPAATLKKVQKILKPGGTLVVAVPNFGSLQSRLFGKHWFHLDLPRHTYHFTRQSLQRMLNNTGFSATLLATRSFDQGVYGFVQSAINSLAIGKPNALYTILKATHKKPGTTVVALQFLLAGVLAPFALTEYILSGITDTGPCLIFQAGKSPA
ncbi:MAG TPA: class I SAM-dependent methyltransferase [Gammaproteobacteria bacterium]